MKKRIKINGFIVICAVILMAVFPRAFLRDRRIGFAEEFLRIAGFGFMFMGQLLRVSGRGYKSEHSQNSGALVKGGPYAAVRNPMYLGILLIGMGVNLVLFQWWVMVLFLSVFITRYYLLIVKEEKKLLTVFPAEYKEYMQSVPRLLPSLKMMLGEISECLPFKFVWIKKERSSIIAVILLVIVIELWQGIREARIALYPEELIAAIIMALIFVYLVFYLEKKTYGIK